MYKLITIVSILLILCACNDHGKTDKATVNTDSTGSDKPAAMDTTHIIIRTDSQR